MESAPVKAQRNISQVNDIPFFRDDENQVRFIVQNIFRSSQATTVYLIYWLVLIASFIFLIKDNLLGLAVRDWIIAVIGGLLSVLLPIHIIHELLRAMLIKRFGKATVSYIWSWPKLRLKTNYFNISSLTIGQLKIANIAPFLFFSIAPFILAFIAEGAVSLYCYSIALFHALYSVKGFSLLSYLQLQKQFVQE